MSNTVKKCHYNGYRREDRVEDCPEYQPDDISLNYTFAKTVKGLYGKTDLPSDVVFCSVCKKQFA